jgi:hypothetical protein
MKRLLSRRRTKEVRNRRHENTLIPSAVALSHPPDPSTVLSESVLESSKGVAIESCTHPRSMDRRSRQTPYQFELEGLN